MQLLVISPTKAGRSEAAVTNTLFEHGLQHFILRLPDGARADYELFLDHIAPEYRRRILIAGAYDLLQAYELGGAYVSAAQRGAVDLPLARGQLLGTGVHREEEMRALCDLPRPPDFVLCSPVFDSISKEGYRANEALRTLPRRVGKCPFSLIALGGITPEGYTDAARWGYDGVAVLGDLWGDRGQELARLLAYSQPRVLSLAGHDPSGGAGITADARVAEAFGARCITIPTMWTVQTEADFVEAAPVPSGIVDKNLEINLKTGDIRVAKIGLIDSLDSLEWLVDKLCMGGVRHIVWDPIVCVSAGEQQVLQPERGERLHSIMRRLYLITPNVTECVAWFGGSDGVRLQRIVDETGCAILLKGGHGSGEAVTDLLYQSYQPAEVFRTARDGSPKHGTGCMLSSAIGAQLAGGLTLTASCARAQRFVSGVMRSATGLLPRLGALPYEAKGRKLRCASALQYVTNTTDPERLTRCCHDYLKSGGRWIQLRAKGLTTDERVALGRPLVALCRLYDAVLIINDDVEAALRLGADGVHLGKDDTAVLEARAALGADKIIGSTCNTEADLLRAYRLGSDYVGVGPFRYTTTKERLAPILALEGLYSLAEARSRLPFPMPMVAIGGIMPDDVPDIIVTGVTGIAISGALEGAASLGLATQSFLEHITCSPNN